MAPVKFDDIAKTSNEVLNDDYQTGGLQFKAKQKTSWDGAVITSAVDLVPGKDCVTPAKLTWKIPKPLGFAALCIDKLEMDKSGGLKLEASSDKVYEGLKVECKSDCKDPAKIAAAFTYTGLADTQLKFDTKALNPADFTCEVTRAQGCATLGVKCTAATLTAPDLGLRLTQGPLFASLCVTGNFSTYAASCFYKVSDEVKCAANYTHGGKKSGSFTVGLAYALKSGTTLKAKLDQDQAVSCSVKHSLSKGFTLLGGVKYGKDVTYGLQCSIE